MLPTKLPRRNVIVREEIARHKTIWSTRCNKENLKVKAHKLEKKVQSGHSGSEGTMFHEVTEGSRSLSSVVPLSPGIICIFG
jgi:hypothetical protein